MLNLMSLNQVNKGAEVHQVLQTFSGGIIKRSCDVSVLGTSEGQHCADAAMRKRIQLSGLGKSVKNVEGLYTENRSKHIFLH